MMRHLHCASLFGSDGRVVSFRSSSLLLALSQRNCSTSSGNDTRYDDKTQRGAAWRKQPRIQLSWTELFFNPPTLLSGEQEVIDAGYFAYAKKKPVVFTAHRGWRKSISAVRLHYRTRFFLLRPSFRYRFIHISGAKEFNFYLGRKMRLIPGFQSKVEASDLVYDYISKSLLSSVFHMCSFAYTTGALGAPDAIAAAGNCINPYGIYFSVAMLLLQLSALCFRRTIYLIDDILNFRNDRGVNDINNVTALLDDIKRYSTARSCSVVLLSSNEGLGELFSDTNPDTYVSFRARETLDNEELCGCLRRSLAGDALGAVSDAITPLTIEAVEQSYGLRHHTRSLRYWRDLISWSASPPQPSPSARASENASSSTLVVEMATSRKFLQHTALKVDLQAETRFLLVALAYSPEVHVEEALRSTTAADVSAFTAADVASIRRAVYPRTRLPRRVLLTVALLVTGRGAAARAAAEKKAAAARAAAKKEAAAARAAAKKAKEELLDVEKEIAALGEISSIRKAGRSTTTKQTDEELTITTRKKELVARRKATRLTVDRWNLEIELERVMRERRTGEDAGGTAVLSSDRAMDPSGEEGAASGRVVPAAVTSDYDESELSFAVDVRNMIAAAHGGHKSWARMPCEIHEMLLRLTSVADRDSLPLTQ